MNGETTNGMDGAMIGAVGINGKRISIGNGSACRPNGIRLSTGTTNLKPNGNSVTKVIKIKGKSLASSSSSSFSLPLQSVANTINVKEDFRNRSLRLSGHSIALFLKTQL